MYAKEKNFNLYILGESKKNHLIEKNFYKKNLNYNFKFLKRTSKFSSYEKLDQFTVTTGIDSTMLYESFSRDNKVIFFSGRGSSFKQCNSFFGWPYNNKSSGFFWTDRSDKKNVFQILDNVIKKKYPDISLLKKNLISYNYKNTLFSKYFKKID